MGRLELPLLLLLLLLPLFVWASLWCHEGGGKKFYRPAQCPDQTVECFKFLCHGGQEDFVTRGCGVSIARNAMGLVNESCHQAASACEYMGGEAECYVCSSKHMCNPSMHSFTALSAVLASLMACFFVL